jgi:hypothetical protein
VGGGLEVGKILETLARGIALSRQKAAKNHRLLAQTPSKTEQTHHHRIKGEYFVH